MCKEMPVIPDSKLVDPKKNHRKKAQGGREAQGVVVPKSNTQTIFSPHMHSFCFCHAKTFMPLAVENQAFKASAKIDL
jgi:hypothetical protein